MRVHETIPKDSQLTSLKIQKAGTTCHKLLLRPQQGTESIDDFFDQPDETDMAQIAIETELELDFTTDIFASSESADQSAEDVMYAYLEAWRNSNYKVIDSLRTEQYRRSIHENSADRESTNMSDEAPE